jgi:hypothetical protein
MTILPGRASLDAALVAHACARLPGDLSLEAILRVNLDPDAAWPCAERARTLWLHANGSKDRASGRATEELRRRSEHGCGAAQFVMAVHG